MQAGVERRFELVDEHIGVGYGYRLVEAEYKQAEAEGYKLVEVVGGKLAEVVVDKLVAEEYIVVAQEDAAFEVVALGSVEGDIVAVEDKSAGDNLLGVDRMVDL